MSSLAQVADAMPHILSDVAETAAREVGFIRRQRVVTGASFVQALVLGWLGQPDATLHQLTQALALSGNAISPQGLAQRFTPVAAALLARVLGAAVRAVVTSEPAATPLLMRFTGVYVLDCTTVRLPDALAAVWPGCGGRIAAGAQAALKLQVRLDLGSGRLEGPALLAGRTHDKAGPLHAAPLPPGALLLQDLGFWSLERLRAIGDQGAYWVSRLHPQTSVLDAAGVRRDLPRWLRRQAGIVDTPIELGIAARLPARLLAARVPKTVAEARRRKLRAAAKREGKQPPQATLALAGWTVYVTNVPPERLTPTEAFVLGRARWQIELLFKLWQQHGQLEQTRSNQPWRVLTEVYAKLTAVLIQHWILLLGCWPRANRSLTRAAQTIRTHAVCLARAGAHAADLVAALQALVHCLGVGGRIAKRKAKPSAFQLWLDPALLGLT